MSSTPEISRTIKFSPYGKPISKSLLTPCRPIGLSRKKKTPTSLLKTPLNSNISSQNVCLPSPTTPVNNQTPRTETKVAIGENPINQTNKRSRRDAKENKDRTVKKCLDQNFQNVLSREKEDKSKVMCETQVKENVSTLINISTDENKAVKNVYKGNSKKTSHRLKKVSVSLEKLSEDEIEHFAKPPVNEDEVSWKWEETNYSSDESEEFIKVKKKRAMILSDDEEAIDAENKEPNEPIVKTNMESTEILSFGNKVECSRNNVKNINLSFGEKLSDNSNDSNKAISKNIDKKSFVSSDDEDDFESISNCKKHLILTRKKSSDKKSLKDYKENNSKSLKPSKSSEIKPKSLQSTKSSISIIDDEDDAFTSTPEQEKNEKIAFIQKVKELEIQVKDKRKKLEDLKQAHIYKTKHNIDELKNVTEIWRQGCLKGLNDLLAILQSHGSMTLSVLLNNLHISRELAKRCLKVEFKEDNINNVFLRNDSEEFKISPS